MRRNRGLRSLKGYREGGGPPPPDTPATGASRALYGHENISKRRKRRWEEQNRGGSGMSGELIPMFFKQWARDIAGAQIRDRLGLETLGNWIGAPDITAGDLTSDQYEAMRETALRAMENRKPLPGYDGNRWALKYPDYEFAVTDPEHATNKVFEAIMGGYDIDYDYEGWGQLRGNKEAIDELVEASRSGWSTVANDRSPLATRTGAGKGPAVTSSDLYKKLRGAAGLIPRMTDPAAVIQQTLGKAAIIRDPDTGNYYIEDRYNWNPWTSTGREFSPFSREDWGSLREDLGRGEDIYDKARVLSEYFGSRSGEHGQEDEGSLVRINLGQLDDYYLDEADQLASREEEDGFQLSDIGEFVRRQGSKVMDFFDRPEEEAPPRLVERTEQREPTVSSTIPSAPAPAIPSAPGAIGVADISRQLSAAQERERIMREMRAGTKQ